MVTLLTGEALQMVDVVPGTHHHLKRRNYLVARCTETRVAEQSAK